MPRPVLSSDLFRARSRISFRTDVLIAGGLISGTFRRFHSADKAAKQVGHTQPDKGPCNQYGYPGHPVGLAHASFRNRGCRQDEAGEEREPNESSARRDQRVAGHGYLPFDTSRAAMRQRAITGGMRYKWTVPENYD